MDRLETIDNVPTKDSGRQDGAVLPKLIVNADDFGFFDGVSRGILTAARTGTVTATGVLANGPALDRWVDPLRDCASLDIGVHLNATLGTPLTDALANRAGRLPSKGTLTRNLIAHRRTAAAVAIEWRAQIEKCLSLGLEVRFLNSHEHVHMLPMLFPVVRSLALEFGIRHVRYSRPDWPIRFEPASLLRSGALGFLCSINRPLPGTPRLLGVFSSGRLTWSIVERLLSRLHTGRTYELMCHPGHLDQVAALDPKLSAYHDWQGELDTLLSPALREELSKRSIQLIGYRDIPQSPAREGHGN
jgi:predicted glycoside hydrolase/deacetylase ChbG (UPF0249 family)